MRSSSLALVGVISVVGLSACSITADGNSVTFKTVPEFVDSSQPAKSSTGDWNGEEIKITNAGVNPLTGEGGIVITVDPSATKVTASAIFAARADTESEAQLSIKDAIQTFTLSESNGFQIACAHGQDHGTSKVAASGCKLLRVTIPAGTVDKPMNLNISSGQGGIRFSGTVIAKTVLANEAGLGDLDIKVTPVKDADINLKGDNKVTLSLPSDFSAKSVTLKVNESNEADAAKRIITTDFQGLENGGSYPTAGATENAAALIALESRGLLDDYTVTLKRQ
ncbi:MAG: hypothetical protein KF819_20165 [Labilithrix sp.]|nr:hypothetical protein [Labilithrix sp.]